MQEYEKRHLELLRSHLAECTVLLKKDGTFPLSSAGDLALYGNGARHTVKGGTGSGEVNSRFFVTAEEGLEQAGFRITTKAWLDAYDKVVAGAKVEFLKEIRQRAKKKHTMAVVEGMGAVMAEPEYQLALDGAGDTAVYVLARISGEGNDRNPVKGDIYLTDSEVRDILALNSRYERFMLVLNVGGPVDLTPVAEVKNILLLSQLGVETGSVLADLLLGRAYPSGKLTTTWAKYEDYCAIGEFGDKNDTRYKEGVYVGYRYFDSIGAKPMFPFGFGLSYTEFSTRTVSADRSSVKVLVKNTGSFAGKETVMLYIAPSQQGLDKPLRTLAAFAKTKELMPGEEQELILRFSLEDAASYDEKTAAWILEEGDYTVLVPDQPVITLRLKGTAVLKKLKNRLGKPDFTDWKPRTPAAVSCSDKVIEIAAEEFSCETVSYERKETIEAAVKDLSDEELAYLAVGGFDPKGGLMSVIGNASSSVAGAAGEISSHYPDGAKLVMSDGPAGLRLSRDYFKDEKGVHSLGAAMPETIAELLPKVVVKLMALSSPKPKKGAEILHQYCTAIPIGTAIAQSWNPDLAEFCGDVVGDEMERFHVHLWLAPALNIHRSIRCGRNFEYFSEDPLISGAMAASITRGVQKHENCAVTIKHFAANNQETNRYNSNSLVSERAMREIYLRGFEIAVKSAQPKALMTSYNLLNGIHTSESRELIEDILRCEWGYRGIVMTDWVVNGGTMDKSSVHPAPSASKVAAAGGDLFMPGGKKDYQDVLKALKENRLPREQLEINASRVYRLAVKPASADGRAGN